MRKKYILFLLFFLLHKSNFGQNYQTVQSSGESFFSDSSGYIKTIRIKTTSFNGTDSVYSNFNSARDTSQFLHCVWIHGPSWVGMEIIIRNDGFNIYFNANNDSIFINTLASLFSSWTLYTYANGDYIEAHISSVDTATFAAIQDSVKIISLQVKDNAGNNIIHPLNGREIKFSKDHGFAQLPDFYNFPANAGLDYVRVDAHRLTVGEVYNYNVGDKFYYTIDDYNIWGQMHPPYYKSTLILVKSFSSANDTVFYIAENTFVTSYVEWNPQPHLVTTVSVSMDTIFYTGLDSILFNNYMPEESSADTNAWSCYGYYGMQLDECQKRIKEEWYGGYYLCFDNSINCFSGAFEPFYQTFEYGEGLGLTKRIWDNTSQNMGQANVVLLTSYVKGSDTCGTAINLAVQELSDEAQIALFPNPASTEIKIQNLELKIERVEIYDILGQRVFSQKPAAGHQQLTVDVSGLRSGIYFLKVKGEREDKVAKFVKE